jgi:A1 cistron-splicing factor AAR2
LSHGIKIVPGAYVDADGAAAAQQDQLMEQANNIDGYHLAYPPIPVLGVTPLKHTGTKRFLLTLSPSERTGVLMGGPLAALHRIIAAYYDADWKQLLGDLQMAYVMFLHLQCLTSMEHWRDLVAMISLAATEQIDESCIELFSSFASLLQLQMKYMDKELFDDADYSGGNFFVAAITRLISGLQASNDEGLRRKAAELQTAALGVWTEHDSQGGDEEETKTEELKSYQEDDSDDEPIVLSSEDIEASLARSAGVALNAGYPVELHQTYPLLFASIQPHEDVVMACSRILDTRVDVSLVREAAAYLAEVEANE